MNKTKKILILLAIFTIAIIFKSSQVKAAEYQWPIGGDNASETYLDYEFYGNRNYAPIKDGKSGREYIVNNSLWPNEKYYYSKCESHYGMDITGINGHSYTVVSVVDGTVLATSGNRVINPSVNYVDRNQRRTSSGLYDGGGYGNYVIIQETSTGRCFLYAHLKGGSIKVSKGDKVSAGQEIATMGSSGDSGHMHLHFEIRKSRKYTLSETRYGKHYLVSTTTYTNLDPKDYIGSAPVVEKPVEETPVEENPVEENPVEETPIVHRPYGDKKIIPINATEVAYYAKYLYRATLGVELSDAGVAYFVQSAQSTGSIAYITKSIILNTSNTSKASNLSNSDFSKFAYEVLLYRGKNYTETEMAAHVRRLDTGEWTREDFLNMICNCEEFTSRKYSAIVYDEMNATIEGIAPESQLYKIGDLNADGQIDATDGSLCLILSASSIPSRYSYITKYADVDGDGRISVIDASYILQYSVNVASGKVSSSTSISDFINRN